MRLGLVLPPGWRELALTDEERTQGAIRKMSDDVPFDDGQGARHRRELRHSLLAEAARARDSGATMLAIAGPRSAPISGSLLVIPVERTLDDGGRWAAELDGDVDQAVIPAGRVVRSVHVRQQDDGSATGVRLGDDLPTLAVDYWLTGDEGRTVLIACSTPLVTHREAMVGLFDAVVDTARWRQTGHEEEP